MAIEYGYRDAKGEDDWTPSGLEALKYFCQEQGYSLIAREVSEPYVVSIRA